MPTLVRDIKVALSSTGERMYIELPQKIISLTRADVLARLQQRYQDAGYERITGELPDYLPMMLEFLSVCRGSENTGLIWECLQGLEDVVDRLRKAAPPYAALLQPLIPMVADRVDNKI